MWVRQCLDRGQACQQWLPYNVKSQSTSRDDIREFIEGATHGVIYMSLGTIVKSAAMPQSIAETKLDVFGWLRQRNIRKWESDSLPASAMPANVMAMKWTPQADILVHRNLRLFITHGGSFGTTEGIYYGHQMLFIPFFGDQVTPKVVSQCFKIWKRGIRIDNDNQRTYNWTSLQWHKRIAVLSKVREKEASKIFCDTPMHPLDLAMYHIEYVIRHNAYLKSAATDMNIIQHFLLDVIGFFLFSLFFLVVLLSIYKMFHIAAWEK